MKALNHLTEGPIGKLETKEDNRRVHLKGETSIEHLNGNVSGDTPSRAIKR